LPRQESLPTKASLSEVILWLVSSAFRDGKPAPLTYVDGFTHVTFKNGPYNPTDWDIIEESANGVELTFANIKTGYCTFYTPPGMTAKEILAIPAAQRYWGDEGTVESYIKAKAEERERCGGSDYNNTSTHDSAGLVAQDT
jgi:hypothetical protein